MQNNKIHITFIVPSLAAGGAERIVSFLAKNIDADKFKPTLLVIGFKKDTVYNVEGIDVVYLNKARILTAILPIIKYLKTAKPHIVLTTIFHLNTLVAYLSVFFPKTKFIAREANILSILVKIGKDNKLKYAKPIIVKAYRLIDCLVCQSTDMQQDMITNYHVPESKIAVINNPITNNFEPKLVARNTNKPLQIITVGRLTYQKGYDRIFEVLSKLEFPFHYFYIGNGPEKENIANAIELHGLTNQVTHIEYTKDVASYLKQSDVYLQGSYTEGFPNALIESCVVGTPIIAFNALGGINEIIEAGENGIIVDSIPDCVKQLTKLNANFSFSPEKVNNVVTERFNSKKIINKYEELFIKLTN